MGFNLKEKLQNLNKKNIAIATAILLVIVICTAIGFKYYNEAQVKAKAEAAIMEAFEQAGPDLSETPKKPSVKGLFQGFFFTDILNYGRL